MGGRVRRTIAVGGLGLGFALACGGGGGDDTADTDVADTDVADTDVDTDVEDTDVADTDTGVPDTDTGVPDTDTAAPDTDTDVEDTDTDVVDTDPDCDDADPARVVDVGIGAARVYSDVEWLGEHVAAVGDLDGDGVTDALVSSPQDYGSYKGWTWVVSGATRGDVDADTLPTVIVGDDWEEAGRTLLGPGDLNGDGVRDVVIGAPMPWEGAIDSYGTAYVLYGPLASGTITLSTDADVVIRGDADNDHLAYGMAAPGDPDGDGVPDVLLGAPGSPSSSSAHGGRAYLVQGTTTGTAAAADAWATWSGEALGDWAGTALATGDLDGDGAPDVLIGAPGTDHTATDAGSVYFVSGIASGSHSLASADARWDGGGASVQIGRELAVVGDLDGDGYAEAVAGDSGEDKVWIVRGPSFASGGIDTVADTVLVGDGRRAGLGDELEDGGDVTGDGLADLLVTAPWHSTCTLGAAGAVWVVADPPTGTVELSAAFVRIDGDDMEQLVGHGVASMGDLDGDGRADLLVGAPSWTVSAAYLVLAADL